MTFTWVDVLNGLVQWAMWFQPAVWMMAFYVKASRFDSAVKRLSVSALLPLFIVLVVVPVDWGYVWGFIPLFSFYAGLALYFTLVLMDGGWHAPQALSVGFLVSYVGSYLWEVPYIVKNAFITGPTGDWFLHGLGLFYVYFMADSVGWKTGLRSFCYIVLSLVVSTFFMMNWNIAPVYEINSIGYQIWNSWYWMFNRLVATGVVFELIQKTPPEVRLAA